MNGSDSSAQISAIRRAIRRTNFSDSITQGPRMKAGSLPPMVTLPILRGFGFIETYACFVILRLAKRAEGPLHSSTINRFQQAHFEARAETTAFARRKQVVSCEGPSVVYATRDDTFDRDGRERS